MAQPQHQPLLSPPSSILIEGWKNTSEKQIDVKICGYQLDTWFDEKVVINRADNTMTYYYNGTNKGSYQLPASAKNAKWIKLAFCGYGWYTGHYQYMDDFKLAFNDAEPAEPEPSLPPTPISSSLSPKDLAKATELYNKGRAYYDNREYAKCFKSHMKAAKMGYAPSQNSIGVLYDNGQGVEKDITQAIYWYRQSAEQGWPWGQCNLADNYRTGNGIKKDIDKAIELYTKAANNQTDRDARDEAQKQLTDIAAELNNQGVEYYKKQDYTQAVALYRKAAEMGCKEGQLQYGQCLFFGKGVQKDFVEAAKWYTKAAEQGNANAQYRLGILYYNGLGVQQDYAEAVKWYRKAAEQGDAWGRNDLGWAYYEGKGVEQDYAEAVKWTKKAADQGNSYAFDSMGEFYFYGRGVKKDLDEAKRWYQKAQDKGDDKIKQQAQQMMTKIDSERAAEEARLAAKEMEDRRKKAEQGDEWAQYKLGEAYYKGKGVQQNYAEAVKWLTKAAQDYFDANEYLAECYFYGRGVAKNWDTALKYAKKGFATNEIKEKIATAKGWTKNPNHCIEYSYKSDYFDLRTRVPGEEPYVVTLVRGEMSVSVFDKPVTRIERSFYDYKDGLTKITIPRTVTMVEDGAFEYQKELRSIDFPNPNTKFGENVFRGCYNLESITVGGVKQKIGQGKFVIGERPRENYASSSSSSSRKSLSRHVASSDLVRASDYGYTVTLSKHFHTNVGEACDYSRASRGLSNTIKIELHKKDSNRRSENYAVQIISVNGEDGWDDEKLVRVYRNPSYDKEHQRSLFEFNSIESNSHYFVWDGVKYYLEIEGKL